MEFQTYLLKNGIRVIHKQVPTLVSHCGLLINAGSRDELDNEHGLAHFIEHSIFKGTTKRKPYHILSRMEDAGGELNAYTTKEETCVHASFLLNDYDRALELINDLFFHSVFPEKEIEREKEVIIDEINSYKDSPSEQIFDDFEEQIFKNNPLAENILGTPKSVKSFNIKHINYFMSTRYNTDQMVISSVGNISFAKLIRLVEKYFSVIPSSIRNFERKTFEGYHPTEVIVKKDTHQTHCIIGNVAYNFKNPKRTTLHLLNNILGGPGLNSRLNLWLREKNGYSYNVESSYHSYTDTGIFCIYFGTDQQNLNRSIKIAKREFEKLRTDKLGILQLSRAKRQLIGQLAIGAENNESLMLAMAKSYLLFDRVDTMDEVAQKIEAVNANEILDVANEILSNNLLSTLIFK